MRSSRMKIHLQHSMIWTPLDHLLAKPRLQYPRIFLPSVKAAWRSCSRLSPESHWGRQSSIHVSYKRPLSYGYNLHFSEHSPRICPTAYLPPKLPPRSSETERLRLPPLQLPVPGKVLAPELRPDPVTYSTLTL